jgi:nitrite reductase/ring-hydroxylating ferredoxin subunit
VDSSDQNNIDTGTAYGMKPATYKSNLVEVGRGTPMGELMRRYWQPCFTSEHLTSDKPRRVRLLGEDLILFRDKEGRPGLVHEHCCHRGASLFYGRVEEDGIRCCYHGWKFDVKGHCLDQPCEVDRGRNRSKFRQPWYPVQERYGLVYAYMGPPAKKPVLPRWKHLENLEPGEVIETHSSRTVDVGPLDSDYGAYEMNPQPYNWLQLFENTTDGPHLPWLHYHHSCDQFTGVKLLEEPVELPPYARFKDMVGQMVVERTELGVKQGFPMPGPDGRSLLACNETMVPNIAYIPPFLDLLYVVPVDDTHHIAFVLWRSKFEHERSGGVELHFGKKWREMTPEEHQLSPGDFEAQSSIGAVPAHNREHLSPGDLGVSMIRRRLEEAVRDVAEGRDPPGLVFDENAPPIETRGHGFIPYGR